MPKKTTILIIILAIVTGVLLYLAVSTENNKLPGVTTPTATPTPIQKTIKVFFNPQNIDLSTSPATPSSVDLMVDTGSGNVSGIQAELQYDPQAITNVKVVPSVEQGSFFGPQANVLFNDIDTQTGRISYAIAIAPNEASKKGVGKIATITFQKSFNSTTPTTSITFVNKTLATTPNQTESVLKETSPLNITLTSQNQVIFTPSPFVTTAPVVSPIQ